MAKVTYDLEHRDLSIEVRVIIDEDFIIEKGYSKEGPERTGDAMVAAVKFWGWWEDRVEENDGDFKKTFLQMLGVQVFLLVIEGNSLYGVKQELEEKEGWFPMDGSYGVEITYVDNYEFDYPSVLIKEVTNG